MFDIERLLGQMLGGGSLGKMASGMSSGLSGVNGGIGSGLSKGALGVGALGVAWAAFEHFNEKNKADQAQPPPPPGMPVGVPAEMSNGLNALPPPPPPMNAAVLNAAPLAVLAAPVVLASVVAASAPPAAVEAAAAPDADAAMAREKDATHLIRAMIAAANADGVFDAEERATVLQRTLSVGLSPATQQFLLAALNKPLSVVEVVVATRPELKRETYAASLMAIKLDTEAEQQYLQALANGLGLSASDRSEIVAQLG